jgi:Tfp pilus assembly protein PilF
MTQAVALAPSLWEVSFSRAFYIFYLERDWRAAEPHFRRAIEINPRSSLAQGYYGFFLAVGKQRDADAVAQVTLACELDPLSPFIHGLAASAFQVLGHHVAADRAARRALELQADYMLALWMRGLALCGLGRAEEAIEVFERAVTLSHVPLFVGLLGQAFARAGRLEDAARLLSELDERAERGEYVPAFAWLTIHVGRGDLPGIRTALAQALEEATPPRGHPRDERGVPRGVPLRPGHRSDAERALPRMTSLIGHTLAHYRITAAIGAVGRDLEAVEARPGGQPLVSPEISRQRSATPRSAAHRST